MAASFEAATFGKLFHKFVEIDKINALKLYKGTFDAPYVLSFTTKDEIFWWRQNIDASNHGWGLHDEDQTINGRWSNSEKTLHINCLELLVIKLAIKSFLPRKDLVRHLRIMPDNSTAIAYINKQGGTKSTSCNQLIKDTWIICMEKNHV